MELEFNKLLKDIGIKTQAGERILKEPIPQGINIINSILNDKQVSKTILEDVLKIYKYLTDNDICYVNTNCKVFHHNKFPLTMEKEINNKTFKNTNVNIKNVNQIFKEDGKKINIKFNSSDGTQKTIDKTSITKTVLESGLELDDESFLALKYLNTKLGAKNRNIEFTLTISELKKIISRKTCYYSGIRFDDTVHKMTLDRKDSKLGYVKGNVVACSNVVNSIKSNFENGELFNKATAKRTLKALLSEF